jgi:signal transduction histidine kinase
MTFELKDKIKLEKALQVEKSKKLQNAKLASLGEMAAGIAHEINNPLTISIGSLKILNKLIERGSVTNDILKQSLDTILSSNNRIGGIVESMRSLSRIKEDVELETLDINEVIINCLPMIQNKLEAHGISFESFTENVMVRGDRSEISQIFVNLVTNSIDAIKNENLDKWIHIKSIQNDDFVEIRFIDSGEISKTKDFEKSFDPFFTTKSVGEGTGLGLSLCRNLMERNNGKIFLDSESANTCFVLCFPKPA